MTSTTSTSWTRRSFRRAAPSIPALTIMANALRVGDHLLERLGASRDSMTRRVPQQLLEPMVVS